MAEVYHAIICVGLFFRRWIHFQTVEEEISAADVGGGPRRLSRRVLPARPAGAAAGRLRGHRGRQGHLGPAQVAFRWMQRLLLRPDPPPEQIPAAAGWNPFRVQVTGTVSPKGKLEFYQHRDGGEGGNTNFHHMSPLIFTWSTFSFAQLTLGILSFISWALL